MAINAFHFIVDNMSMGDRLLHSWRQDSARHPATLDDYANMCRAAVTLFEISGDQRYLDHIEKWLSTIDVHYADSAGGYFLAADDTANLVTRTKNANDNAVPAGNGVLVGVFARLYFITGDARYREKAEQQIKAFSGEIEQNFFPLSTLINGNEILQNAEQVVLIGSEGDDEFDKMARIISETSLPNRVLSKIKSGSALPEGHPAAGKTEVDGKTTAYICRDMVCSVPITDSASLKEALSRNHA